MRSPRSPQTLRGRLALTALAAGGLAVVLLTVAFDLLLVHRLGTEADAVLRSRAEAALSTIDVHTGDVELADGEGDSALGSGIWVYRDRVALERAPGPAALQARADSLAGTAGRIVRDDTEPPTEFLSLPIDARGKQIGTVVAAISLDPYRRSSRLTVLGSAVLDAVLVGVVLLLARSVAARALQPVEEMTRQAGRWSVGDTSLRFGRGRRPAELQDLADGLDKLLDRLSAVLRREQQMTAEISHELRTPLAGIVAEAELFGVRPRTSEQAQVAMTAIGESARRMERILDTLLSSARATSSAQLGRCDARLVADEAVAATSGRVPMDVTGQGPAWAGVDPEVLERVLVPLLDNAQRYAVSRVEAAVEVNAGQVVIRVLDDGPGVPDGSHEEVFEPGLRLQPQDGHDGAGLGLALARRLAVAASGSLRWEDGGFTVRVPRA